MSQAALRDSTMSFSKYARKSDHSLDGLILRMDAMVFGMKLVKEVPVDLVGVRSYNLEFEDKTKTKLNFGMVVRTQSCANGKKMRVSFESQVLFANN